MEAVMNTIQTLLFQMSVNLSGGNVGMAKHFLNDAQVCTVLQKMSSERMSKDMWEDMLFNSGSFGSFTDDLPDSLARKRFSAYS